MTQLPQRDPLIQSLPLLKDILRGSLLRYVHQGCRCHPKGRYVYWYLSVNSGGKTQMHKLKIHQVPLVRQALKNYRRFKKLCRQIFEINTKILLSKEA
jgi:hypothetical protein